LNVSDLEKPGVQAVMGVRAGGGVAEWAAAPPLSFTITFNKKLSQGFG